MLRRPMQAATGSTEAPLPQSSGDSDSGCPAPTGRLLRPYSRAVHGREMSNLGVLSTEALETKR